MASAIWATFAVTPSVLLGHVRELTEEVRQLRAELSAVRTTGPGPVSPG